jgi:hypothetical protein
MSTSASLDTPTLVVEPGSTGSAVLQVNNTGQTVESYQLEVVGPDSAWMTIEPATLSLYPGTSGTATLTAAPPRSAAVAAGSRAFGVRVLPVDHPDDMVVPEATVEVLPFADLGGELLPRTSTGIARGRHRLAIDNRGNAAVELTVSGRAETDQIKIGISPRSILVPAGEAIFSRVRVTPVRRVWRGSARTHPFELTAAAPGGESVVVDGGYQQQAVIPSWVPRLVAACLVLGLLLVGVWYALMRPAIRSSANEAAEKAAATAVPSVLAERGVKSGDNIVTTPKPNSTGNGGGQTNSQAPPPAQPTSTSAPSRPTSTSTAARPQPGARVITSNRFVSIQVQDAADGNVASSGTFTTPVRSLLSITDILLQNPQGDFGSMSISVNGAPFQFVALENFRDDQTPLVTPVQVPAGSTVTVAVICRSPGTPAGASKAPRCFESVTLNGSLRTTQAPTPTASQPAN